MTSIYTDIQSVRDLTGLTTVQATESVISGCIQFATAEINADVQIKWDNENVCYISGEKKNTQDSSNTTFYTRHYPIGDRDNDGVISGIDVYAYTLDSDSARAEVVVSSIDDSELGKVTLSSAPSAGVSLYFSYYSSPVELVTPHALIKLATSRLAAALCFTRIDVSKVQSFRVGKVAVMKQSQAYDIYRKQYEGTLNRIRQEMFKTARGAELL